MRPGWIVKEPPIEGLELLEGEEPIYIPGPSVVAKRALCLLQVQIRCLIEHHTEAVGADEARATWCEIRAGFDAADLGGELLDEETALLDAKVGAARDAVIEATWQIESLGVLFWAMGRLPRLPPFDTKIDVDAVLDVAPKGADEIQRFVAEAALRPDDELEREEWRSYHWLWRIRAMPRAGRNVLSPSAREANEGHAAEYPDDPVREGDLVVYEQPLFRLGLASKEIETLRALVELRAHALRWMTHGGEWDDVAMAT